MPREAAVLTTEFKINLLSPAKGDRLRAVGRVIRNGKTLVITLGEVFAESAGVSKQVAMITASMQASSRQSRAHTCGALFLRERVPTGG